MVSHTLKRDNEKLTLSIDKRVLLKYKDLCTDKGLVISKQVENFMREELKK